MNENVLKFYEVVSADGALQAELVAVTEDVDLDNLSEEEALQAMAEAIAEFAAAHDLDLTAADVLEAHEAVTSGELSEEELAAVGGGALTANGGAALCVLGGGGGGSHPFCIVIGKDPNHCGCYIAGAQN